jgi:hypothetical protein
MGQAAGQFGSLGHLNAAAAAANNMLALHGAAAAAAAGGMGDYAQQLHGLLGAHQASNLAAAAAAAAAAGGHGDSSMDALAAQVGGWWLQLGVSGLGSIN